MALQSIYDIDFIQLYKTHKKRAARPKSSPDQWDQKSHAIEIGQLDTPYTRAFIQAMGLHSTYTLLDVGSGSGAIAVLAASQVRHVYALDFSVGMLNKLMHNAQHYNTHNITTLCKDWEDDWAEVPQCDIVVASRSTLVDDMASALLKLESKAKKHIYLTYPAHVKFGTAKEIDSAQTPELATPSYIYVLAILHQLGRRAQLRFISNASCDLGKTKEVDWALIDWEV